MPKINPSVLIVPGYKLYPYNTGAGLAQFAFIDELRHHMTVSVLLSTVNVKNEDIQALRELWTNVNFHFWNRPAPPLPKPLSTKQRIVNKLNRMVQSSKGKENTNPKSEKYQRIHYNIENIITPVPKWMSSQLDALLNKETFDLIQFDLPINMGLANVVANRASTLFVHHEIKFMRIASEIEGDEPDLNALKDLLTTVKNNEIARLNSFDQVQAFTDSDCAALRSVIDVPVEQCSFSLMKNQFHEPIHGESMKRLIFIGPDQHIPNLDAIDWFVNVLSKEFPNKLDIPLHVIGNWSDENIQKYESETIIFEGFVDDLKPWFRNSAMIAPIRTGAGVRTKIMESLAGAVPVISTDFAAQGIANSDAIIRCKKSGISFWNAISELRDPVKFQSLQLTANQFSKNHFSPEQTVQKRIKLIHEVISGVEESKLAFSKHA